MNQYKLLKLITEKNNESFGELLTDITDEHVTAVEAGRLTREDPVISDTHLSYIQIALNNGTEPEFAGMLREAHELISQLFSYVDAEAIAVDPVAVEETASEFDEFDDLFDDDPAEAPAVAAEDTQIPEDDMSDIFGDKEVIVVKEAGAPFDRSSVSADIPEPGPWDDIGNLPPMTEDDVGIDGAFEMGGDDL